MSIEEKVEFFDKLSETWDQSIPEYIKSRVYTEWFSSLKLNDGMCVLDFGCGTGRLLSGLWEGVKPGGKVYAADISPKMLEAAKKKNPGSGVEFLCSDVYDLKIDDASLDMIILFCMFPHLENPGADLSALVRKLKDDGDLWIVHIESRQTINSLHRGIGGSVGKDKIPEEKIMREIISTAGLGIMEFNDLVDRYIIRMKKNC